MMKEKGNQVGRPLLNLATVGTLFPEIRINVKRKGAFWRTYRLTYDIKGKTWGRSNDAFHLRQSIPTSMGKMVKLAKWAARQELPKSCNCRLLYKSDDESEGREERE